VSDQVWAPGPFSSYLGCGRRQLDPKPIAACGGKSQQATDAIIRCSLICPLVAVTLCRPRLLLSFLFVCELSPVVGVAPSGEGEARREGRLAADGACTLGSSHRGEAHPCLPIVQ
jgi:hypothetical protein